MNHSEVGIAEAVFIEEFDNCAPLFYKPFSISGSCLIETLEAFSETTVDLQQNRASPQNQVDISAKTIIEERGGIHYINQTLLGRTGGSDQELNQDFKKLVDSIIG